ncbi:hypothetical protein TIFTF001_027001 [Ficus carica]|uniref:Uncharacterized protein n=1 Tax=Ficus carica TaxID=3494 RepID=A0AA88DMC7_FICCA|nr:hypothetical protein TIFTF001_027001 [Ficus carica]
MLLIVFYHVANCATFSFLIGIPSNKSTKRSDTAVANASDNSHARGRSREWKSSAMLRLSGRSRLLLQDRMMAVAVVVGAGVAGEKRERERVGEL